MAQNDYDALGVRRDDRYENEQDAHVLHGGDDRDGVHGGVHDDVHDGVHDDENVLLFRDDGHQLYCEDAR